MKNLRLLLALAFMSLAAGACGSSSILAPDCEDPTVCEHTPDSGSHTPDSGSHTPDSGS